MDHLLRVHDDVDPVERDVEEQVRLDDLEALVDQGRGVRRDDAAHREVGVRQRLLGRDVGELSAGAAAERPAARGDDQPANLLGTATRRHWAMARCSESTGTIWPGRASALTNGPPMISDSLLASASVVPARRAAKVGSRPIAPVMPLTTTSASRAGELPSSRSGPSAARGGIAVGPACPAARAMAAARSRLGRPAAATTGTRRATACSARSSMLLPADRPTTSNRSGLRLTRSMAWVPIEPVEPSRMMRRGRMVVRFGHGGIVPRGASGRHVPRPQQLLRLEGVSHWSCTTS